MVKFNPPLFIIIIGLGVFVAALESIGISFILPIVRVVVQDSGAENDLLNAFRTVFDLLSVPFTLETMIIGVSLVLTVRYALTFVQNVLISYYHASFLNDLRQDAYDKAMNATISYFDNKGSDEILHALITEVGHSGRLPGSLFRFARTIFLILAYFGLAFYITPVITTFSLGVLLVIFVITRHLVDTGFSTGKRVSDANEEVQQTIQSGIQGIRAVKIFGMVDTFSGELGDVLAEYKSAAVEKQKNISGLQQLNQLFTTVGTFVLVYMSIRFFSLKFSSLAVFLFAMFRLAPRVSSINDQLYKIETNLPHLVRANNFVDELEAIQEPNNGTTPVPETIEAIEFDSVSFSYEGTDEYALDDVSLRIPHGSLISLAGQSGAGKSTIASLITRLYLPTAGDIRANDIPITEFKKGQWRSDIAVVRQDPHVFNETVRKNITVGRPDADEADVQRACEIAQVTEFVPDLPNGLDTGIGEDGVRLSGGQRQRLAIARAVIMDSELIILDEATSHLDTELEKQVYEALAETDTERTVLVIAHRLSTLTNSDRIYVLDHGEVVEEGTHTELIENSGIYGSLFEKQYQKAGET